MNGKARVAVDRIQTPLTELIAKDPPRNVNDMTVPELREYAAEHHVAIAEGLSREEIVLVIRESLVANWDERVRGMIELLEYIYQDGPHPVRVFRRVTAIVKAIRPRLIPSREYAVLCCESTGRNDGERTANVHIKRLYEEPLTRKAHVPRPFQAAESVAAP